MAKQRRKIVKISEIRALSGLQCSEAETAAALGVTTTAFREMIRIDAKARDAWEAGRELGRVSIRRKQFALADRHPQMAIFLGKQYLGQNDVQVVEHSGRDGGPIKTLDLGKLDAGERSKLREVLTKARVAK